MIYLMISMVLSISSSGSAHHSCRDIDINFVRHQVRQALDDPDSFESKAQVSELINYWRRQCPSSRQSASAAVVIELSSLLRVRTNRFNAPWMLSDVGSNLKFATQAIENALAEEVEASRGSDFGATGAMIEALRCVLQKARSGEWNPTLCSIIDQTNRIED